MTYCMICTSSITTVNRLYSSGFSCAKFFNASENFELDPVQNWDTHRFGAKVANSSASGSHSGILGGDILMYSSFPHSV